MSDAFEESLREMLKSQPADHDDDACLDKVLKTANRRVGAGDLFTLMGRCLEALAIGLGRGANHLAPTSRQSCDTETSAENS